MSNTVLHREEFRGENVRISSLTPIQKFYDNANIFITGSTGFLGTLLLEKILRCCPTVSTVYVLIRNKKGKNMETRFEQLFDDEVFETVKKECPDYKQKVRGIEGDCCLQDLGLNSQDRSMLINTVNIIFHVAATVRFDEKLDIAVTVNVRPVRDLARLAKQMLNLKSFMYVSTAFSNCVNNVIEEKIYPASIDYEKLISMVENLPKDILNRITPTLIGKYPNTYSYTKQIGESIIEREGKGLPVGIFRPSVVISTYKEPIAGWINNFYGPSGVASGFCVGLIRVGYGDKTSNANLVPADMCINTLIAQAWDVSTEFDKAKKENINFDIPVYTYDSGNDKPIIWNCFLSMGAEVATEIPTIRAIWWSSFTSFSNYAVYLLGMFLLHIVPAAIVDGVLLIMSKPPRMLKLYSKIHKYTVMIGYFGGIHWKLKMGNVYKLIQKMTDEDKQIFFSDLKQLDWATYLRTYIRGVRIYLIKDPLETVPEGQKKK